MHSFSWSVYCLHRVNSVLYCVGVHIFMFNIYWLGMDILIDCCFFFFVLFCFVFYAFETKSLCQYPTVVQVFILKNFKIIDLALFVTNLTKTQLSTNSIQTFRRYSILYTFI